MNGSSGSSNPGRQRVFQCSKVKKVDVRLKSRPCTNEFEMEEDAG